MTNKNIPQSGKFQLPVIAHVSDDYETVRFELTNKQDRHATGLYSVDLPHGYTIQMVRMQNDQGLCYKGYLCDQNNEVLYTTTQLDWKYVERTTLDQYQLALGLKDLNLVLLLGNMARQAEQFFFSQHLDSVFLQDQWDCYVRFLRYFQVRDLIRCFEDQNDDPEEEAIDYEVHSLDELRTTLSSELNRMDPEALGEIARSLFGGEYLYDYLTDKMLITYEG